MNISTTVTIDEETVFTIKSNPETNEIIWVSRSLSDKKLHSIALMELAKISYQISKQKIQIDSKRIENFEGPLTLG